MFIIAFTRVLHLPLCWGRSFHAPTLFLEDPFLYYSCIYPLLLEMVSFPQVFPPKSCMHPSCSPHMPHDPPISFLFYHPNNAWWRVQLLKLLIILSSPVLFYVVRLRYKYLPQHPIFECPQSAFFPQRERPSSATVWNNKQNYGSVCINLNVLGSKREDRWLCTK